MSCISTIIQDHIGLPVFGCDASIDTPPEILFRLATPGENGEPCQQKTKQYKRRNDTVYPSFKSNWIYFDLYRLQPMRQPLRSKKTNKRKSIII
jgi:hypothetical protein